MQLQAIATTFLLVAFSLTSSQAPTEIGHLLPPPSAPNPFAGFGATVAIGDNILVVGDPGDNEFGLDSGAVFSFNFDANGIDPQADKIVPTDAEPFLGFGSDVSAHGNRIAVTASEMRTYVFRHENDGWEQEAVLPFGGTSVSLGEHLLAIGVPFGSVVIYRLDPGPDVNNLTDDQWVEDSWILGGTSGDAFGYKVALDHDRVFVGAPLGTFSGVATGLAYVFERTSDGSGWLQKATLEPVGATSNANFGRSACLQDDLLLVGAPWDHPTGAGSGRGSVYVYRRNPVSGLWAEETRLQIRGGKDDTFGASLAIAAKSVFIGAYLADIGGMSSSGAVYEFRSRRKLDGTASWHRISTTSPSGAQAGDGFGCSMAFRDSRLLVGAIGDDAGGGAYVFGVQ